MTAFPDISPDEGGYSRTKRRFQNVKRARDGGVQINAPHPNSIRVYTLSWSLLTSVERDLLSEHLDSDGDGFFPYFDAVPRSVASDRAVGTGDGITASFTLPAREVSGLVVKVNGVTKTAGVHYNIQVGTGTNGEDQIVFTGGNIPPATHPIVFTATSQRERVTVFYVESSIDDGVNEADIYSAAVILEEQI
jgi:hypothetical protein